MRFSISATALALALAATTAWSQDRYVTGNWTVPDWQPSVGAPPGGGTAADLLLTAVPGEPGLYSVTLPAALHQMTADQVYLWAAAANTGFDFEVPGSNGGNAIHGPINEDLAFYVDVTQKNDGFVPDAGDSFGNTGIIYSSVNLANVQRATSVQATGSFQESLGGSNWNAGDASAVTLTAIGGGFYEGSATGFSPGGYEFKITLNGAFDPFVPGQFLNFGARGLAGDNLTFTVVDPSDTVTFTLDANRGRTKVENDNPEASPGPPFFASSAAWVEGFSPDNELIDVSGGAGTIFGRAFTVTDPGDYRVRVEQGVGRGFPNTGSYPFTTTEANQQVAVIFDRTIYSDLHYTPFEDFVVVLDAATREPLNEWRKVQPVGDWMEDFGAGNWNADEPALDATEVPSVPGLYVRSLTELEGNTRTDRNFKAVGQREGSDDGGFFIQFGGPMDGVTIDGNNSNGSISYGANETFLVYIDTATGRLGKTSVTKDDGGPERGAYFDSSFEIPADDTSVDGWLLLQ